MSLARELDVLVIDPDPSIRALLTAVLRRTAARVTCVGDHDSALRQSREKRYAAVILEPRMHGGDVLLRELCALPAGRRPTIIVATTGDGSSAGPIRGDGVDVVLTKPFEVDELTEAVEASLSQS